MTLLLVGLLAGATAATDSPRLEHLPGKQMTDRTISLEASVACDPRQAYELWATEQGVKSFFAPRAFIDGKVGGRYAIAFFPEDDPKGLVHGTTGSRLLAAEPGKFIAFEWVVFAGDDKRGRNAPPFAAPDVRLPGRLPTWVEIQFQPDSRGTQVKFRHYGFAGGELWGRSHEWFGKAWAGVLSQMGRACMDIRREKA